MRYRWGDMRTDREPIGWEKQQGRGDEADTGQVWGLNQKPRNTILFSMSQQHFKLLNIHIKPA